MTQRLLRSVPVAIVVTTALAWNLPVAAQGSGGGGMPPSTQQAPSTAGGAMATVPGAAGALPRAVVPAMPAVAASDAASQASRATAPPADRRGAAFGGTEEDKGASTQKR